MPPKPMPPAAAAAARAAACASCEPALASIGALGGGGGGAGALGGLKMDMWSELRFDEVEFKLNHVDEIDRSVGQATQRVRLVGLDRLGLAWGRS